MPFTVVWLLDALDQLAERWMASSQRDAITAATSTIDAVLGTNPDQQGVDFYGDRLLVAPPLHAVFRVKPDDMIVEVTQVW